MIRPYTAIRFSHKPFSCSYISVLSIVLLLSLQGCREEEKSPAKESISEINLKRGEIISCGTADKQFGMMEFASSSSGNVKEDLILGIKLLHSFEYDEAEKSFAKVIDKEPATAIAYWGVAMSNFHPLWTPPTETELEKGEKAIHIAQSLKTSKREKAYIDALAVFYKDWRKTDHKTRTLNFEKAMEELSTNFPDDKETAVFYALALMAAADPNDKSFVKQKKAGEILNSIYPGQPDHPGIVHYLIHTFDYPELASQGLAAARKYASVAPSSAHALHMPSHIFTRLGLWNECITSNLASVAAAKCYAESAGIKGHWDEELHGLDYLVYAYLQQGSKDSAKKQLEYLKSINKVSPLNFKVAYAYAAIPSRYVLENKLWKEAADLVLDSSNVPWQKFPWQEAIVRFSRIIGAVNTDNLPKAKAELNVLNQLHDTLMSQKDSYKANQVAIQINTAEAWILLKEGRHKEAISIMQRAADMEDKTEKHPVTPGEVIPAREFLGDMYLHLNMPDEALAAYEADLKKHPNRFNAVYGAGLAAQKKGDTQKARSYFQQLIDISGNSQSSRTELASVKEFLKG